MKVNKLFPLILILFPYFLISPIVLYHFDSTLLLNLFGDKFMVTVLGVFVVVFGSSLLYPLFTKADPRELAFWNMIVKLCHIPFYIFIFILGIGVMIAIPLLFIIDAIILILSSAYGISALVRAAHREQIGTGFLAVNLTGHLFFVADVICSVIVWRKLRK